MATTKLPSAGEDTVALARAALDRAVRMLLADQHEDGFWADGGCDLGGADDERQAADRREDGRADERHVTVTAVTQDLLLREVLGIRTQDRTAAAARLIRSRQRLDGGWPEPRADTADQAATIQAYVILRLMGDSPDAYHMALAAAQIRDSGGLACADAVTRVWLALAGMHGWNGLPAIPPEIVFLPGRAARWLDYSAIAARRIGSRRNAAGSQGVAGNSDDGADTSVAAGNGDTADPGIAEDAGVTGVWGVAGDWGAAGASDVMVPLAVLCALSPVRQSPPFDLDELAPPVAAARPRPRPGDLPGEEDLTPRAWAVRLWPLRAWPARAVNVSLRASRAAALRRCAAWMLARQENDGSWGQGVLPSSLSLMALSQLGYELGHPALVRGLGWLDLRATWAPGSGPSGLTGQRGPASTGGMAGTNGCSSGGRAERRPVNEHASDCAVRDTALAVAALTCAGLAPDHTALTRAAAFLTRQPISDAGRGVVGGRMSRLRIPAGQTSVAAKADEAAALSAAGVAGSKQARRDVVELLRAQQEDGSWRGGHRSSETVLTATVARALIAAGVLPTKPAIRRAVRWLVSAQAGDGGWHARAGSAAGSDAVATAVAVQALIAGQGYEADVSTAAGFEADVSTAAGCEADVSTAAGCEADVNTAGASEADEAIAGGVRWLALQQRPDGSWAEPAASGPRFSGSFLDGPVLAGRFLAADCPGPHLFSTCCPMRALSAYLQGAPPGGAAS